MQGCWDDEFSRMGTFGCKQSQIWIGLKGLPKRGPLHRILYWMYTQDISAVEQRVLPSIKSKWQYPINWDIGLSDRRVLWLVHEWPIPLPSSWWELWTPEQCWSPLHRLHLSGLCTFSCPRGSLLLYCDTVVKTLKMLRYLRALPKRPWDRPSWLLAVALPKRDPGTFLAPRGPALGCTFGSSSSLSMVIGAFFFLLWLVALLLAGVAFTCKSFINK